MGVVGVGKIAFKGEILLTGKKCWPPPWRMTEAEELKFGG